MARKDFKPQFDSSILRSRLKLKQLQSEQKLARQYPRAAEFLKSHNLLGAGRIREHATKLLTSGALAGSLLLAMPQIGILSRPPENLSVQHPLLTTAQILQIKLAEILPPKVGPLTAEQETRISHLLFEFFGIKAVSQLGSTRLNNVYGLIGAEQHLPRFSGDTLAQHDEYRKAGIAPGLGSWGYFAPSKAQMTRDDYLKEKYYVAVQTLYLPDWKIRLKFLVDWYKHRKVVVINPQNGKAIVAVVGDAGPARWTGKHFGGSPEVMAYLGLNVGWQKGPVILYFVDDPDGKVPLGPLEYNLEKEPPKLAQVE